MSSLDDSTTELNDCGCCEGISVETPAPLVNRPGLAAIAYRVGTHSQFLETLLARLSGSRQGALARLSTRDADDFSIALLDAWATVGDVLTFYQERIANEAYLRTATERLSVLELARLINYQLRPGVAASTYLAFTLEDAPGALGQALAPGTTALIAPEPLPPITIAIGVKVQSIPGPGEQAQTFETVEEIEARSEWSAIKPRLTQPQFDASFIEQAIIVQGTTTNLKKSGTLLIVNGSALEPHKILNVTTDDDAKTTRVDLERPPADFPSYVRPSGLQKGSVDDFAPQTELTATVVEQIINQTWDEADLAALAGIQNWSTTALVANIREQIALRNQAGEIEVFAYRQQVPLFGFNAPKQPAYNTNATPKPQSEWTEWELEDTEGDDRIFLDNGYEGILGDSYITIEKPEEPKNTFQIKKGAIFPRTAYGISSKTTQVTLQSGENWRTILRDTPKLGAYRDIIVHAESEQLSLAELPIPDDLEPEAVAAEGITLDGPYLGLKAGSRVILTGERSDLRGVVASEALTLKAVIIEAGFTVITFNESLAYIYVRDSVTINANVALATHGETVQETLGGGDATQAFQRFTLLQPPLTYVSSSDPSGGTTTLEVRVNDILWSEVADFYGHEPEERIYITRLSDDGKTTVIFGDGVTGARLPTGQENIKAKYRKGTGLAGLVKANQLTQLMTRPLGVKGVTDPIGPAGGADPEQLEDARENAPLTVLTLDRVVSLKDYEDFARSFSGFDKALATWTWFGEKRGVFLTVAGSDGAVVEEGGELHGNLLTAIRAAGDPLVPLQVKSFQPRLFRLTATVTIDPDFLPDKVIAEVEQELRDAFSFAERSFGQPVHLSEVIAIMARVSGVVAVVVKQLYRSDQFADLLPHIAAAAPLPGDDEVLAAELLTLDPQPLELEVVT